ncbi:hypothetical protein AK812_SmicGene24480 [Symbiodinium microadriaticum]|uniref:Uncharacterized protein n=1 Tax=Symbiodinium microadriaticum TaxID=2951 RepID=A0A1Q9DEJ3_SYMMI|nr:hypothetical protein AK812_SmicGene24480 [Symbiodinium microadriaticum]
MGRVVGEQHHRAMESARRVRLFAGGVNPRASAKSCTVQLKAAAREEVTGSHFNPWEVVDTGDDRLEIHEGRTVLASLEVRMEFSDVSDWETPAGLAQDRRCKILRARDVSPSEAGLLLYFVVRVPA